EARCFRSRAIAHRDADGTALSSQPETNDSASRWSSGQSNKVVRPWRHEGRWGMSEDSLGKVKAGLRRGLWLLTLFLAAGEALGFARYYAEFVFRSLRLVFADDGTVLRPTLEEWPSVLRVFRRANRRAFVSSRKGGGWQRSELEHIRQLLGSRSAALLLYERTPRDATSLVNPRWTAVAMFFVRKWWQQGDAVRNTADDIEKLLVQMKTSPVS